MAPFWLEVEPTVIVSHRGDVSFRLSVSYDLYITERLIVHPSFDADAAVQSVPKFGVSSGFNDIALGLRLGYQIARERTPDIGISWTQMFGESARLGGADSGTFADVQAAVGLRFWL